MRTMPSNERGAVLVYVGIIIIALLAMTALTFDFGIKWVARGQAQNAADAGALAGAIALSFDDPDDLTDTGLAKQSAQRYALANLVVGESPDVNVTTDVTFPPCPDGSADTCIKVDVYRNQARQNPLPTFFARLVNVSEQGVVATATAQIRTANATNCLRPWAIVDRWAEYVDPGGPAVTNFDPLTSTFDRYRPVSTGPAPRYEPDVYEPPTLASAGTGWSVDADQGQQFAIKTEAGNTTVSSGWVRSLDLPRRDTGNLGGNAYGANITSCNGYLTAIAGAEECPDATVLATFEKKVEWAAKGCVRVQTGVIQGQTIDGIRQIYESDPDARWVGDKDGRIAGGVSETEHRTSPRVVPIAVMDIDKYLAADPSGSGGVVRIVNIFGFFIEGMGDIDPTTGAIIFDANNPLSHGNKVVVGRLVTLEGVAMARSPITESASFLKTIILVR